LTDKFVILCIVEDVHLSNFIVFELWVIFSLLRNANTTPEPNTHNFLLLFSTKNEVSSETPLSEIIESLKETLAHVFSLIELDTFTFVHFVVEEPD
jgi:hypothetical protein